MTLEWDAKEVAHAETMGIGAAVPWTGDDEDIPMGPAGEIIKVRRGAWEALREGVVTACILGLGLEDIIGNRLERRFGGVGVATRGVGAIGLCH